MKHAGTLHARLAEVAPVLCVDTLKNVTFSPDATDEQRIAAKAIVDAWTDDDFIPPDEKPAGKLSAIKRQIWALEALQAKATDAGDAAEAAALKSEIDALIAEREKLPK